jgi:hypothetical protein
MGRIVREIGVGAVTYYAIATIAWPTEALAYVDPGSGSVIVTAILGAIGAICYTFRKYFYKAKRLLGSRDKK